MSDIIIVVATVVPGTGAVLTTGIAGATILQGQTVYIDTVTNTIKLADANASALTAVVAGIAVNTALTGQVVVYQTGGILGFGVLLTAGKVYVQSANAGGIAPVADLASTWYTTILGVAITTSNLQLNIWNSGLIN